jgi:hypothetical protein
MTRRLVLVGAPTSAGSYEAGDPTALIRFMNTLATALAGPT